MVTHIVLWSLKDKTQAPELKRQLEGLVGRAPGLVSAQVGLGFAGSDVALIAQLTDRQGLEDYQAYEPHVKIKEWVATIASQRTVCDFEC